MGIYYVGIYYVGIYYVGIYYLGIYYVGIYYVGSYYVGIYYVGIYYVGIYYVGIYYVGIYYVGIYYLVIVDIPQVIREYGVNESLVNQLFARPLAHSSAQNTRVRYRRPMASLNRDSPAPRHDMPDIAMETNYDDVDNELTNHNSVFL